MALMRFDPLRELDRLSEQVMDTRGPRPHGIFARQLFLGDNAQQELPDRLCYR
jgi:hypothetical protein